MHHRYLQRGARIRGGEARCRLKVAADDQPVQELSLLTHRSATCGDRTVAKPRVDTHREVCAQRKHSKLAAVRARFQRVRLHRDDCNSNGAVHAGAQRIPAPR